MKNLLHPLACDLFEHRRSGATLIDRAVLFPGGDEPIRSDRTGQRSPDHPTKETRPTGADETVFTPPYEIPKNIDRVDTRFRERNVEVLAEFFISRPGRDVPVVHVFIEVDCCVRRGPQDGGVRVIWFFRQSSLSRWLKEARVTASV